MPRPPTPLTDRLFRQVGAPPALRLSGGRLSVVSLGNDTRALEDIRARLDRWARVMEMLRDETLR